MLIQKNEMNKLTIKIKVSKNSSILMNQEYVCMIVAVDVI